MKTGVLCIHGFTGGPYEVQPFVDYLHANTDWKFVVPTLPGHGETLSLEKISAENWMMEAELALRQLQKEVDRLFIIGFSMGGVIALYLANRYKIDKLILLSAAAKYIYPTQLLQDIREIAKEAMTGKLEDNSLYKLYRAKLKATPIHATIEFMRLVRMVEPYYGQIKIPICLVQGKKDGIVPYTTAQFLFDQLGSDKKELIYSEVGKHHICYSDDSVGWYNKALQFLMEEEVESIGSN
ncbi:MULTISPECIES: alpha/beta fold hydrolase [Bacillaceae]|uniref:alpha/beta hydrolase n=1 Tax=Bacillaceae TaxID=186817 RepID=UPI0006F4BE29|nr:MULTISPECIES: alpha/beta fold hydrolase [Bacillaceae]KQL34948.1 carboxylesterase [Psychrobacillus sp. FJAT-21963]MDF2065283.1 alpha/beta fold hydrolase [Bacillus sp. Cr_A10]